jgi:DNA-directed RNA polymerase subunit omega
MARITIQDCLKTGYNKFALVHLAAKRVFQLKKGKELLVSSSNKEVVNALREIAAEKVKMKKGDSIVTDDLTGEEIAEVSDGAETGDDTEVSESDDELDEPR